MDKICDTWYGRDLVELTKEELILVIKQLGAMYDDMHKRWLKSWDKKVYGGD